MKFSASDRLAIVLGFVCCLLSNGGCDRGREHVPPLAPVEGTVTLDGQPLESASIVFIPEAGGRPSGGLTDYGGSFELHFSGGRMGAIPGRHRVQITTFAEAYQARDGRLVPQRPEIIPVRYNTSSELEFVVEMDEINAPEFHLESGGPVDVVIDSNVWGEPDCVDDNQPDPECEAGESVDPQPPDSSD